MWPISCNMIGWIWLAYVNKENYRISLKAIIFSSQDLYPAIWLVEIGSPNVNKENRRVTLISYYIPVMWPESCNMIGWNCVCQCKQRKSLNIADQALYFGHVTWITQSDWVYQCKQRKSSHINDKLIITVTWHVSHNLIGWNCYSQCKQRKFWILIFNLLFPVTWPTL